MRSEGLPAHHEDTLKPRHGADEQAVHNPLGPGQQASDRPTLALAHVAEHEIMILRGGAQWRQVVGGKLSVRGKNVTNRPRASSNPVR